MRSGFACWVLLLSCGGADSEEPESEEEAGPAVKRVNLPPLVEEADPAAIEAANEKVKSVPVKLYLDFVGIGALHKTFFMDTRVTRKVQQKLQGHVSGPVGVLIEFKNNQGRIRIQVDPEFLVANLGTPGAVQMSSLVPLTQAAAFYRDWVAGNFDLRVHNFEIGLDITPKNKVCKITVTGDPPPDGTQFTPCIEVDGTALCGELTEGVLRLPPVHHDAVGRCF